MITEMVYMLLAEGFEEIEAVEPLDVLRRCGIEVTTVGLKNVYVKGSHDIIIVADKIIDDINCGDVTMLILPGGPGRVNYLKSEKAVELIRYCCDNSNVTVAAICGAPEILAQLGLIKGKKATCFPGLESVLTDNGAEYVNETVVIDGNLITSKAAGTAEAFAFTLAEKLAGKARADEVYNSMVCGKK